MAKTKQTVKLKAPVQIRFKQLANGNQSIYLDYYTGDVIRKENYVGGKRQYEFLKLYLIPERTREDKTKNEATLALAKAIQSKRIVEIQNDAHGFQNTNKSKVNLLDYLESIGKQSAERGSGNYARTVLNTVRGSCFGVIISRFAMSINSFFRSLPISCGRCPRPANTECGKPEACWGIIRSFPITARCARRSTEPIKRV